MSSLFSMNNWRITGSKRPDVLPRISLFVGTVRQPRNFCPSSLITHSKTCMMASRSLGSGGRKTKPAP
jgi:hypothetical protein